MGKGSRWKITGFGEDRIESEDLEDPFVQRDLYPASLIWRRRTIASQVR